MPRIFLNHYPLNQTLQLPCNGDSVRAIDEELDQLLTHSGFIRNGKRGRRYSSIQPVQALWVNPAINVHLGWTWDLEWHSGRAWLIPLARHHYVSGETAQASNIRRWIEDAHEEGRHAIHWRSGIRSLVRWFESGFRYDHRGRWMPSDPNQWRITFSMSDLRQLGCSERAAGLSSKTFREQFDLVRRSPFTEVVQPAGKRSIWPNEVSAHQLLPVSGQHLQFGRGRAAEPKDLRRLKMYRSALPPEVTLVLPVGNGTADEPAERAAHEVLKLCRDFGFEGFGTDTVQLTFHPETGTLTRDAQRLLTIQCKSSNHWKSRVVLCVLPDEVDGLRRTRLHRELGALAPRIDVRLATLQGGIFKRQNVAAELIKAAGGTPFRLVDLPKSDRATVILGVDLGHDHRGNRSRVGLTLFSAHGDLRGSTVIDFSANDERLDAQLIRDHIPRFIYTYYPRPYRVIVHRDGRFLDGEVEDFESAMGNTPHLSLVAIKKDPCSRFSGEACTSTAVEISESRALLLTSDQARARSIPCPLEVELVRAGDLSLADAVAQVYWLCRVHGRSMFHVPRLPATTRLANDLARSGKRRRGAPSSVWSLRARQPTP
jgi:hypothetical protein